MAPTTPKGAISTNVRPLSPVRALDTISSVPGVLSATKICLSRLCSTRPMPVSATPRAATVAASSRVRRRISVMIFSLCSTDISRTALYPAWAASIAAFMSSKIPTKRRPWYWVESHSLPEGAGAAAPGICRSTSRTISPIWVSDNSCAIYHISFSNTFAPYSAKAVSCSAEPPLTPSPPTILPSRTSGTPPPKMTIFP